MVGEHRCERRRTSLSCDNPISVSILSFSTSYVAPSDSETTEDNICELATGAELPLAYSNLAVRAEFNSDPL